MLWLESKLKQWRRFLVSAVRAGGRVAELARICISLARPVSATGSECSRVREAGVIYRAKHPLAG